METTQAVLAGQLPGLMRSWRIHLEAANRSPKTIKSYMAAGDQLAAFLAERGMPTAAEAIRREHVESFIVALMERTTASTAATRYRGLQQLFKWLVDEGEIQNNPMARMQPPKMDERPVPVITDTDRARLLKVCDGRTFEGRRDTAILRVMLNTGTRLAELANLRPDDIDFDHREIVVTGKGRKTRGIPLGPKTTKALDRYLRERSRHPQRDTPYLWIGPKGRLTDSGITQMIRRRCRQAGIDQLHPHQFRHTWAHLWLTSEGAEHDLAKLAGWTSLQMVGRYASSAAVERAKEAHRRIAPGEDI
jgi:site-specific recombinase XerD